MFTPEEIKTAKAIKHKIINGGIPELKSLYMAGEIVMWDEMIQCKNDLSNSIIALLDSIGVDVNYVDEQGCSHLVQNALAALKKHNT